MENVMFSFVKRSANTTTLSVSRASSLSLSGSVVWDVIALAFLTHILLSSC